MKEPTNELVHIAGNTWVIDTRPTIPVYFLDDHTIVLLDSGYVDKTRPVLDRILAERDLRVRAVIGSHSHVDHNGNHGYLQARFGAEIILRDVEAAVVANYGMLAGAYGQATRQDLERDMPFMILQADRTFSGTDPSVTVDGAVFGLMPLPGHTAGQTGILTPDDALYVGDALLNQDTMTRAKLPTSMDWHLDQASKLALRETHHAWYILAHGGWYQDVRSLVDEDLADRSRRLLEILGWIGEKPVWTMEGLQRLLWERLGVHTKKFIRQRIFARNVTCAMGCLVEDGWLTPYFEAGVVCYRARTGAAAGLSVYGPNPERGRV